MKESISNYLRMRFMKLKRFLFLPVLMSFVISGCSAFKSIQTENRNQIDSLFSSELFQSAQAAVSVFDLTDNKQLIRKNDKLLLRPASNQKILTSASAYLFLGPEYKFTTSLYHTGIIKDSVCYGDLYVAGGFDPDFNSGDLDSLVLMVRQAGIKRIEGNLYADVSAMDSLFWGEGWMWDDDPGSYAPYLTPLNINKDCVRIGYGPGEIGKPAIIDIIPNTSFCEIVNTSKVVQGGKSNLKITRDWINRKNTILISGEISNSARRDTLSINVFNPAAYFLKLMEESLVRNGLVFTGKTDTMTLGSGGEKIFSIERNLDSVILTANKESDNLNAEMLLRALAFQNAGKRASAKDGIVLVDSMISLAGLNPKNFVLVDGSGLSFYNLISAELITGIFKYFYYDQPELFKKLLNSLPIAGIDGTLSNRMKKSAAFGRVHAKTGTISGASSLSGYLFSSKNHLITFSILIQNYAGGAARARAVQDKLCELLVQNF